MYRPIWSMKSHCNIKNHLKLFLLFGILIPFAVTQYNGIKPRENVKVTIENQHQVLLQRITPYFNKPYQSELFLKQNIANKIVDEIKKKLSSAGTEVAEFPVGEIVPSPETKSYRNKDDFTVFYGADGNERTVGYLTGSPSLPGCNAVRPTHLSHVKDAHKRLSMLFEDYLAQSQYKPCYDFRDGGLWKRLTVRSNEAGDLMAIVVTHPSRITSQALSQEMQNLTDHLIQHEPNLILYHQECGKVDCSQDLKSYNQLAGKKPYLIEKMGNVEFQISPHSFFQINKKAAEQMVGNIWEQMNITNDTTFLDMFCGVGLYSLTGSKRVRKAIGIELLEGAVKDAQKNAEINNITNCKFITGRVETNLSSVLKTSLIGINKVMTLINPGRAGTTKRVVSLLREDRRIKKLIYVSCKPDNQHAMNNFVQLCRKGGHIKGTPFEIKSIQLYDLFPRTAHFEMVLEFARDI